MNKISKSVLVVEDSPVMRQMLVLAVEAFGNVEIAEASDGVAALKAMRTAARPYDLILLDLNMPIMDGLKLLGFIQNEPSAEHTVVAVVTTVSDVEAEQQCRSLGATFFLRKPVTRRDLTPVLDAVLS